MQKKIVIAGGSGHLGQKICDVLVRKGADVHMLTRENSAPEGINSNKATSHSIIYEDVQRVAAICRGSTCIVSALSGLREVIIDAQALLLEAAMEAGVSRFIPSDFCIDFRPLEPGQNRNLDLRREFATIIDGCKVKATSVLNGMFTDLLRSEAPVILKKQKRILLWGSADQKMDFTSIDNTAEYTAAASLDDESPRWLRIAGHEASMRDLREIAGKVYGEEYNFFRPGGLKAFQMMIRLTKTFAPGRNEVFPAWQGMQYLHDMLTGLPKHRDLDNDRYPEITWTTIDSVLKDR